jgi:hypothetical protein
MSQRLRIGGSERRSASAGGRKNKKRRRMPLLEGLLRYIELLSLTLWVGGIAFFSFVASPSIFAVLGTEGGGKVIRDIFPKYYRLGYGAGGVGTGVAVLLTLLAAPGQRLIALLLALMTVIFLYMGRILCPFPWLGHAVPFRLARISPRRWVRQLGDHLRPNLRLPKFFQIDRNY